METGAARGSSRPGLPEPVPLCGALEPVSARSGRQACRRSAGPCLLGLDVAKAQWDRALRPSGERWAVPNDPRGVPRRVDQLQARSPTLMGLEAPGGLERLVPSAWAMAGLPIVVVNPRPARDGARATGPLATTAAWEARALAHCADVMRPPPRPLPDAPTHERRA